MNIHRILIAGGDIRQLYCAARLADVYEAAVLGFDDNDLIAELGPETADISAGHSFDCAVLPVSPLNPDGTLFSPCSAAAVELSAVNALLAPNSTVFTGGSAEKLSDLFSGHRICDYLVREDMSLKNAVPTAEGAVQLALEELPVTLSGSKVLIAGMGRIGTALAEILKGFGADITAAVHTPRGAAKARLHGIGSVPVKRLGGDYKVVFNTVPKLIFNEDMLRRFGKDSLFIDLASAPHGIDFEAAEALGIRALAANGLPGKTAPVTAGEIIAETVSSMIEEGGGSYE